MSIRYQKKAGFREQRMGDEVMVFDAETDKVHVLNTTSAFVWKCLESAAATGEIRERLLASFDTQGVDDLDALIRRALDQLEGKGLIEAVSGPA